MQIDEVPPEQEEGESQDVTGKVPHFYQQPAEGADQDIGHEDGVEDQDGHPEGGEEQQITDEQLI